MEFSQLLEYDTRNFFLENYAQSMVEKLFADIFLKIKN